MTYFVHVDPILKRWSQRRGVPLSTRYRDEEVRSFQLIGPANERAQIWVEVDATKVSVHVWDYKKRRETLATDVEGLESSLDLALAQAMSWTSQR